MSPDDFKKKLTASIQKIGASSNMKIIGKEMADQIKKRTLLGYGVSEPGGNKEKLKPLDPKYVESRKKFPKLSDKTTPRKSNLTRTGQMLASIDVKSANQGTVSVGPIGGRNDGLTNEELAKYVAEAGRPFNTLSKPELQGLIRFINDMLSKILKL